MKIEHFLSLCSVLESVTALSSFFHEAVVKNVTWDDEDLIVKNTTVTSATAVGCSIQALQNDNIRTFHFVEEDKSCQLSNKTGLVSMNKCKDTFGFHTVYVKDEYKDDMDFIRQHSGEGIKRSQEQLTAFSVVENFPFS